MIACSGESRMWAIESTIGEKENIGWNIERTANTITAQLGKDK
jgi:hypothetical protein